MTLVCVNPDCIGFLDLTPMPDGQRCMLCNKLEGDSMSNSFDDFVKEYIETAPTADLAQLAEMRAHYVRKLDHIERNTDDTNDNEE